MKEKFIRFLKDHHAFDEFKIEIRPYTMQDLNAQLMDASEFVLQDGCIFYWLSANTDVDWEKLNKKWEKVCHE